MILISSCLIGKNCKYNGGNNLNELCLKLYKEKKAVIACPECLGGLDTPRTPSEVKGEKFVFNKDGVDVTSNFIDGAEKALKIAKKNNVTLAILKSKSPSCGFGKIYDGNFSNTLIDGNGIFANLLAQNNIEIITSDEIEKIECLLYDV